MKEKSKMGKVNWIGLSTFLLPLLLFWVVLSLNIPVSFSKYFHSFSVGLFFFVLIVYYVFFRLTNRYILIACFGFTMLLFAIGLSYKWTSGFSDNQIMGGLVPYKDAKNFYLGSNLILSGLPPLGANQSTERPLFPSFFASVLLFTGQNLKIALAVLVQLIGVGIYLCARQFYRLFGAMGAGLYATFLYFYIQPWVGYAMSETFGFTMGCLSLSVILSGVEKPKWRNIMLAGLLLMVAVSARAGTFFIFPMLALWLGWIFRGEKQFSVKVAIYTFGSMLIGYLLVNPIYSRLLGIPPGSSFGNFSYALYGQARGGTGWHSAIAELGTRDPAIVYRATWEYFLEHPISLFIGFAKSYRDFFLIGDAGILPFREYSIQNLPGVIMWLGTIFLLVRGLFQLTRHVRSNFSSLLFLGFIGVFVSIPFLPPIDGGARFYASTSPFFFALPAVGLSSFSNKENQGPADSDRESYHKTVQLVSIILIAMAVITPLVIRSLGQVPTYAKPECPSGQVPFVIEIYPGSYIDFIKDDPNQCRGVPDVCFDDFKGNNTEKTTDDFYQELFRLTEGENSNTRIVPAIDWVENKFHYFYLSHNMFPDNLPEGLMSGCAIETRTTNQSIYKVESVLSQSE